ncbi:hypothetical protein NHX12_025517 [Muraenolepis orangiensis]|uniref:BZIP domain-containing protein n=1 Tax=Muraenolepis orangiensis TaxID=630683 RepID=A0A9Q0ISD1_9TELE|nr:hypothetical protein NHX12_025517 [Muraenolepis orangiensis]
MEKMSGRLPVNPSFLPSATHGVLKSLLENPLKLPVHHEVFSKEQKKEKTLEHERNVPQSAFLGPTLWDKTLPYDGDNFQLEYMDLEEFLSENGLPASRNTPSPINPDSIQVPVGYDPDPADLALSSVPGQEMFDPRKHKFSADDLKPQPMIKKARKVYIPEDCKDDKYWARRRKNNVAAKRSRDARRLKENQIAIRACFLEKENQALKQEVAELRKELGRAKNVLVKYEARHGAL